MSEQVGLSMWLVVAIGAAGVLGVAAFGLYWFLGRGPEDEE